MSGRDPIEELPSNVVIRAFRPGDADALRSLWVASGFRLIGDDDDGLARFAVRNPESFLVAERDGQVVGSAMGAWDGRRGWIYHVTTAADLRRRGLAAAMVRRVEDVLRGLGCPRCLVIVERGNDTARAFWIAQGYEIRDTFQLGKSL
jgi:ribosomal protein S18 acetylase RimI-like enzyme